MNEFKNWRGCPRVDFMFGRTGKPVVNQTVTTMQDGYIFQSYHSRVAAYDTDLSVLYLGLDWNYSNTTLKYLGQFLRVYAPRAYAKITAHNKHTFSENIRAAIDAEEITYLPEWR